MSYFSDIDICISNGEATTDYASTLIDELYTKGLITERLRDNELKKLSSLTTELEISMYLLSDLRKRVYAFNSRHTKR